MRNFINRLLPSSLQSYGLNNPITAAIVGYVVCLLIFALSSVSILFLVLSALIVIALGVYIGVVTGNDEANEMYMFVVSAYWSKLKSSYETLIYIEAMFGFIGLVIFLINGQFILGIILMLVQIVQVAFMYHVNLDMIEAEKENAVYNPDEEASDDEEEEFSDEQPSEPSEPTNTEK